MANNKIQIKRSVANATVTGLSNGELAFTQASNTLHIGLPDGSGVLRIGGAQYPGTLTNSHALVANATGAIDKIITANAVVTTLWANGAAGSNGQVLVTNGSAIYWGTGTSGSNTQVQFNDSGVANAVAGFTFNKVSNTLAISNTITTNNLFGTTVNAASYTVGTNFIANTSQVTIGTGVGLSVNGSVGTANQVLRSSGTSSYWADDVGDISAITAGDGLNGGGTSGDITIDVGAGVGIFVNATAVGVLANSGIVANSTGTWAKAANGTSVDASGINVVGGTGVTVNTSGVHIGQPVGTTDNVTFANVVTTNITINGNTTLGDSTSDRININASVTGNVMPTTNNIYYVGNNTMRWAEGHFGNVHSVTGYFDGRVEISGDLIVSGNVSTTNVSTLSVSDPLIQLAANNTSDLLDIGFVGHYSNGAANLHTGLFRDASDGGIYKLFVGSQQELSGNNTVNTAANGFTLAILETYLESGGLTTNTSVANLAANSTYTVNITANTLSLSTALAGTSGGTGKLTVTNNALLVGNSSNGYNELTLGTNGYVLQSNGVALVYDVLDGGSF
jgi:hypothetical protein